MVSAVNPLGGLAVFNWLELQKFASSSVEKYWLPEQGSNLRQSD